jgi:hypothetical protein
VYESGLPATLGLGAPELLEARETEDGIELRLEDVAGRHGRQLTLDDLDAAAYALGRAQGAAHLPEEPWLSRGFLADYSGSRLADWRLLYDDEAWAQPLVARHFDAELRAGLVRLRERRAELLALSARLPRTLCHLDVWPNNLIRRDDGEIVFLDWAFAGDGAIGEDIGNLVPDSPLDLLVPHELLDELAERLERAYVAGLREAGWDGDERFVALGIRTSAIKYDWLTVYCLAQAGVSEQRDYGGGRLVDVEARYAARSTALRLLARWADEACRLADGLGLR